MERIREVTLRGTKEIVLPAGAEVYSDEVEVTVKAGDRIAVNIYIDQQQKIQNSVSYTHLDVYKRQDINHLQMTVRCMTGSCIMVMNRSS